MLQDLADLPAETRIETDVCIVGAGAAGISLARSLRNSSLNVCLLESGGFDHESTVTDLGSGENRGQTYYDLVDSRLRFFGGTTNIWGGRCVPLDAEDFEKRPWVPHSGWPINLQDLEDGYRFAHEQLELGEPISRHTAWERLGAQQPEFLGGAFTSSFWYFDEQKERFNASHCDDLFAASNIKVLTHASVTHLQAAENAAGLTHVQIRDLHGNSAEVTARAFVLAAGAIENARLLLASRDIESQGVGNRHDQVGRYFMEHPHGRLGRLDSDQAFALWSAFNKGFPKGSVPLMPVLRPSPELQEQGGILNTALTFKQQRDPEAGLPLNKRAYMTLKHQLSPNRINRTLWHSYNKARRTFQRYRAPLVRMANRNGRRNVYAMIRAEQAPNPDSRVVLSQSSDALGLPRADLNWQTNLQDKHTLAVLARELDLALQRAGGGHFKPEVWISDGSTDWPVDPTVGNHPIGGYHHMGTTRMAEGPESGVVDKNCQVFGYSNLYISGSSVFSTAGWANPTLTIIALAHRLAAYLQANLRTPSVREPSGSAGGP
jgi:choline dehydrogenase-like flavoprotein